MMTADQLRDHMEAESLAYARVIVVRDGEKKSVCVVEEVPCSADYMVTEIWHGEKLGNSCYLCGYKPDRYGFELTESTNSSELL